MWQFSVVIVSLVDFMDHISYQHPIYITFSECFGLYCYKVDTDCISPANDILNSHTDCQFSHSNPAFDSSAVHLMRQLQLLPICVNLFYKPAYILRSSATPQTWSDQRPHIVWSCRLLLMPSRFGTCSPHTKWKSTKV